MVKIFGLLVAVFILIGCVPQQKVSISEEQSRALGLINDNAEEINDTITECIAGSPVAQRLSGALRVRGYTIDAGPGFEVVDNICASCIICNPGTVCIAITRCCASSNCDPCADGWTPGF